MALIAQMLGLPQKELKIHSENYIRSVIMYVSAYSTGGAWQKYKAYLGQCIHKAWAEGWEPGNDQGKQIDKDAIRECFGNMSETDLKFLGDAGNRWAVEELEHRGSQ